MRQDLEHLRILGILYYVMGGLVAAISCFSLMWVFIGIAMLNAPPSSNGSAPPPEFGWMFIMMGLMALLMGLGFAGCSFAAGHSLQRQKGYVFTLVIAGLACLWQPLGTALGVFTFIVLLRQSVKELYGYAPAPRPRYDDDRDDRRDRYPDSRRGDRDDPDDYPDRRGLISRDPPRR